tara:strand:+ start:253 stop:1173 length:921 start_codon:yes stop_codon:yes gene_type:complete
MINNIHKLLVSALLLGSMSTTSTAQVTQQDLFNVPYEELPAKHLWNTHRAFSVDWRSPSPLQTGVVTYNTVTRNIHSDWMTAATWDADGEPQGVISNVRHSWSVSFFPTDVARVDDSTLLVAGKLRGTETVIELWKFKWPSTMPPVTTNSNGDAVVKAAEPRLVSRKEIYRGDDQGRRVVSKLIMMRGGDDLALIQFDDLDAVFTLNLTTGALTLIASPTGGTPLGLVHGLADKHPFIWSAEHSTAGHIYVMGSHRVPWATAEVLPDALVFVDSNRDNVIDHVDVVSVADWDASIYGKASNYVNLY